MRAGLLAAALAAAVLALPSASVAATPQVPIFNVGTNEHLLGETGDWYVDAYYLDYGPNAERMTISIPHAFQANLTDVAGSDIGRAYVGTVTTPQGTQTGYEGRLVVLDQSTLSNDPSEQACDPNVHTAVWGIEVKSDAGVALTVPVAVDWTGSAYELVMCFDSVQAQGLEVSEVDFHAAQVFTNPLVAGNYLFDGVVTPSAGAAYEFRGYEDLPQILTVKPSYNRATKILTVSGASLLNGQPRGDVNVHIWAGKTPVTSTMKEAGVAVTRQNGTYSFRKKLVPAPKYVVAVVDHYYYTACSGSTQPGGCVSSTTDGRDSYVTLVKAQG